MLTKEKVIILLKHMPDMFTVDELVNEIILLDKIEKGKRQIENGEYINEEDVDRIVDSWN